MPLDRGFFVYCRELGREDDKYRVSTAIMTDVEGDRSKDKLYMMIPVEPETARKIERVFLLPTFFEERIVVLKSYLQALQEDYPEYVTKTVIHKSAEIARTYSIEGATLDKKSRAYNEYLSFVHEILGENDG